MTKTAKPKPKPANPFPPRLRKRGMIFLFAIVLTSALGFECPAYAGGVLGVHKVFGLPCLCPR